MDSGLYRNSHVGIQCVILSLLWIAVSTHAMHASEVLKWLLSRREVGMVIGWVYECKKLGK